MDKRQRLRIELARDRVDTWAQTYARSSAQRDSIRAEAGKAITTLKKATIPVSLTNAPLESSGSSAETPGARGNNLDTSGSMRRGSSASNESSVTPDRTGDARVNGKGRTASSGIGSSATEFRILPLGASNIPTLSALAAYVQLPPLTEKVKEQLHQLDSEIPEALRDVLAIIEPKLTARRGAAGAEEAAEFLLEYVSWGLAEGLEDALNRITPPTAPKIKLADALSPAVGLRGVLGTYGTPELIAADTFVEMLAASTTATERHPQLVNAVTSAHDYVVVCAPEGYTTNDLIAALTAA